MRKLTLDLDDLRVESFHVEPAPLERGTVQGHVDVVEEPAPVEDGSGGPWFPYGTMLACSVNCSWPTCWLRYTCAPSCNGTCEVSCGTASCPDWECSI